MSVGINLAILFLGIKFEIRNKSTLIVANKASWHQKYELICKQADKEEPPLIKNARGKPKNSKGRNLLNRLEAHQTGVLAFAFEEGITGRHSAFTNNVAENDIRNIKIKQKVAMSFRTMDGAKIYARIQGCLKTFKKQGLNLFQTIVKSNQKQEFKVFMTSA
jgi:transposase